MEIEWENNNNNNNNNNKFLNFNLLISRPIVHLVSNQIHSKYHIN
jgi:hypothetical protein